MPAFDVLVAGGGCAGLAAAVSAARRGARTLLIERGSGLGGQAPAALVHSICGLYHLDGERPVPANAGFAAEFVARLEQAGGAHAPVKMGRVWVVLTQPAIFGEVAETIARETPRLEVRLNTPVGEVDAATWIDTTGDGALAAHLGAPYEREESAKLQRPAWIFGVRGLDRAALGDEARMKLSRRIVSAVQAGILPADALGAAFRATWKSGEAFVTIDLTGGESYDPTDVDCLAALDREGRALGETIIAFLRAEVPGFAACEASAWPSRVGVRESRRIVGQYRVEAADLESGARFDDGVAVAAWPIELRETNRGPRLRYPEDGRACDVPLRALRFRDEARAFMAGRCLSCSHEAQASLRVIGTCLASGEAAGFAAAALALDGSCDAASVRADRARISR